MTERTSTNFAINVRFIRKAAGISDRGAPYSQEEFAEILDVTKRSIILWESGAVPNRTNLGKVSSYCSERLAMDVTPEILKSKDITGMVELIPRNDFERELSPEHRKILRSLFMSAGNLSEDQLRKVLDYIESMENK